MQLIYVNLSFYDWFYVYVLCLCLLFMVLRIMFLVICFLNVFIAWKGLQCEMIRLISCLSLIHIMIWTLQIELLFLLQLYSFYRSKMKMK